MQSNVVPDAMPRTIPMTTANMRPEIETLTAINKLTRLGALQRKQIPKIRDYYGSGWVGLGLTRIFCLENRPKIALNHC